MQNEETRTERLETERQHRYTGADWAWIAVAACTAVPFVAVRFLGFGSGSPFMVAAVIGIAIVAASFFLSWGVETLETIMPQAVALAILALIEVAPEYSFEALLAFRQQTTLAAASMTGANRLLLGLGWPLILFVAYLSARRRGQSFTEIQLDTRQAVPLFYLLVASLYAFVIVAKATLSWIDAVVLILIYVLYLATALRLGSASEKEGEEERKVGIGARTKNLPAPYRRTASVLFLTFGAFVLYFGAEPFIDSILAVARYLGVAEFVLIQWLAPFLSEFPESLTAFICAAMVTAAAIGMSNLISSKLNQWTLLIATIPIAYSLGGGRLQAMALTPAVRDEVFLTAAQSLFGIVLLLTFRFSLGKAWALLGLFLIQFFISIESVRLILAWIYVGLAALVLVRSWRQISLAQTLRTLWTERRSRKTEG